MSDKAGDIVMIVGALVAAWGWLKLRASPKGKVTIPSVTMTLPDGTKQTTYAPPLSATVPPASAPFSPSLVNDFFMPSMSPQPTQAAAAGTVPDVLSLADARSLAKSIINKHFAGRVDPAMVTAMIEIESGFRRKAYRYESHLQDASYGLMQVMFNTAKWLHDDLKYRGYAIPNGEAMYDAATGIYFGCAYIDWLKKQPLAAKGEDAIVMSYNGGPGRGGQGADNSMTRNHLAKYHAAKARQAQVK